MSADTEGYSARLLSHDPDDAPMWIIVDRFGIEVDGHPVFNNYKGACLVVEDLNAAVFARRFA
jgi:hypothetical protein